MIEFRCPACAGTLVKAGDSFECARCGVVARWENGIVAFAGTSDYFFDVIPREDMNGFLDEADRDSWPEAFYALGRKWPSKELFDFYVGPGRAGWKFLLPIGPGATALDVGCGWGNIALDLARNCRELAACELTRERLRAFQGLARAEGLSNVIGVHANLGAALPFPDASFDIVVVNGVMEWIPETQAGHPRRIQRAFLQEVGRVLKPRGVVYVAIENRMAYTYLSHGEEHTGLLWGSLLPRPLSDLYSRWKRGKPYRTYTYTQSGYRRLFHAAGMKSVRFYSPLPDYRAFDQIIALDQPGKMTPEAPPGTSRKGRLRYNTRFLRRFGHSFAMIASPAEAPSAGLLERLLTRLEPELGGGPLKCRSYRVRTCEALLELTDQARRGWMVRLPYSERQALRTRSNAAMLRALATKAWSGAAAVEFPKLAFAEEVDGQFVCVESRVAGLDTDRLAETINSAAGSRRLDDSLAEFLADFGAQSWSEGEAPAAAFGAQLGTMIRDVSAGLFDARFRARFDDLVEWVSELAADWRGPYVWVHGDFNRGNCIWHSQTHSLAGVVDWDLSSQVGFPGSDLLDYFAYQRSAAQHIPCARCVIELLQREEWSAEEKSAWRIHTAKFALDREDVVPFLLTVSWIRQTWQAFRSGWRHLNYQWVEANVRPVLEAVGAGLSVRKS
jgi:ubiquinone/menaquinone biosynthesis C-methylase UbiE/aminoglycoside phosphotransferase (APT) family kinase protein